MEVVKLMSNNTIWIEDFKRKNERKFIKIEMAKKIGTGRNS